VSSLRTVSSLEEFRRYYPDADPPLAYLDEVEPTAPLVDPFGKPQEAKLMREALIALEELRRLGVKPRGYDLVSPYQRRGPGVSP
jgi:hypothetical protein